MTIPSYTKCTIFAGKQRSGAIKKNTFEGKSVIVVGIVKDIERTLDLDLKILDESLSSFASKQYFVVESNSKDGSILKLEKTQSLRPDFTFETLIENISLNSTRTERLSNARNRYIEHLDIVDPKNQIDYVVVTDFNYLNRFLNKEAVESCLEIDDWEVCTSNQNGPYYDIWALRHKLWSPNDCWEYRDFLLNIGVKPFAALESAVFSRMIRIPTDSIPIEVDSAFGGFAIYKRSIFKDIRYEGMNLEGRMICEHVSLNEKIRSKNGRILINPKLINFDYTNHSRSKRAHRRTFRYLKMIVKN